VLLTARRGAHFADDFANNAFDIGRIECHCRFFLSIIRLCGSYPPLRSGANV
jgi:hypothetical protein